MSGRYQSHFKSAYVWLGIIFLIVFVLAFKFPVGQKLTIALSPLFHVVQVPVRWAEDLSLWFDDSQLLQAKLASLQEKTLKQQTLKQELSVIRAENTQLRKLLKITQIDGYIWHAARVVSRGQEQKSRRLMLKTGLVAPDDIIVSHEGLVGLVDESGLDHAIVRTILDASIAVPVTMKNSSLAGLVRGDGSQLQVDFVPLIKAPNVGDVLLTSGAGGLFPAGLPVAIVEQVRAVEGGVFAEVIARPAADWQRDAWLAVAQRTKP